MASKAAIVSVLCSLPLCAHGLAQTPRALAADYDVTFEEKGAQISITAAATTPEDELWVGIELVRPRDGGKKFSSKSRLWKLDKSGKKVVDLEIKYPGSGAKEGDPSTIKALVMTAEGPKAYVDYSNLSQFWALQFDTGGKRLRGWKVITRSDEAAGGIRFAPDLSHAVIIEGASELSHLDEKDKLDWTVELPVKEDEGMILDVIVSDHILVSVLDSIYDDPKTLVFSYDRHGKLLHNATLPGIYVGLSAVDELVQLFRVADPNDALTAVLLDPESLQVRRELLLPGLHNFAALLRADDRGTALLVSPKDAGGVGISVLDRDQQRKGYRPLNLDFEFKNVYLASSALWKQFLAGNARAFMLGTEKTLGTARVISFQLPVY